MTCTTLCIHTDETNVLEDHVQGADAQGPTERDPTLLDDFDPDGKNTSR